MKHVFVINPAAGKTDPVEKVRNELKAYEGKLDYEIYVTQCEQDATRFVREYCKNNKGKVRFYACGGDGTLNEVAGGAVGFKNASITSYPVGSGNDYVKYYGGVERFMNLDNLINATEEPVDIMKVGDRYAINATHFGFDSCVAATIVRVKRKKIIGGRNSYPAAVIYALIKAMKTRCGIKVDGKYVHQGDMLLCTIANGKYVGGSYQCAPRSVNNDGLLEICIARTVPRLKFIQLMGPYQKGEHLDDERFKDKIIYARGKKVEIEGHGEFCVALDGEVLNNNHLIVENLKKGINFAVPGN